MEDASPLASISCTASSKLCTEISSGTSDTILSVEDSSADVFSFGSKALSESDSMDESFSTGILSSPCESVILFSEVTKERFSADTNAVSKNKKHIDKIKSQLHIIFKY